MLRDTYDAVERLHASHTECSKTGYTAGYDAGKDWAKNHATFDELQRLKARIGDDYFTFARTADRHNEEFCEWFAICMGGRGYEHWGRMYWHDLLGRNKQSIEDEMFVAGFIDASLSFFNRYYQEIVA